MNEYMIYGTGVATGILLMAIWHGVHVWLEARALRRKMAKVAPWDKPKITDIMSAEDADKWEEAWKSS